MFWKNTFQFSWRFMGIFCSLLEFRLGVEFGDPRIFLLFGFSFWIGLISRKPSQAHLISFDVSVYLLLRLLRSPRLGFYFVFFC